MDTNTNINTDVPTRNLTDVQRRLQRSLDAAAESCLAYAAPEVPALGNLTPQGLLEEFGRLNDARKSIEKTEKIVKERLKSQLDGKRELRGDNYSLLIEMRPRYALDQGLAKAKLVELGGEDALNECMVSSETEFTIVKPL